MSQTELLPSPTGHDRVPRRTAVGADDRCSWVEHGARCPKDATDTVRGKLYCSLHAGKAAGI